MSAKPTAAEIAALLEEALAWPLPWTQEQENRVLAIGPARRRIYSRVNEEQMKKLYPIGAAARVWTWESKHNNQVGKIAKYYYSDSPNRGFTVQPARYAKGKMLVRVARLRLFSDSPVRLHKGNGPDMSLPDALKAIGFKRGAK